jgi:branched-subunit amino acid ABC-type transport system permease component
LGAEYRDVIPFLILTLMLYIRPSGLFGSPELVRI